MGRVETNARFSGLPGSTTVVSVCDPSHERLERVVEALRQQVGACQLDALAAEEDLELEAVDLADGILEESVELAARHICARIDRRGNLDRVRHQPERLPVVRAGVEAVFGDLGRGLDAHAQDLALGVELVRQFLEELQVLAAQVAVQALVVDVDALVEVADRQVDQRVDVRRALRRIDQHVVAAGRCGRWGRRSCGSPG